MKFKKEHGIIIGFVMTLLVPLVAGIFVHNHYDDEKKTPASYPTYFSDSYFQQVNSWFDDHSPFRSGMIDTYTKVNSALEEPFRNWLVDLEIRIHGPTHEHVFSEWEIVKEATEEESGLKVHTCEICGKTEEEVIPMIPHVHTYSTEWSYDGYEHWHAAICKHTSLRSDVASHEYGETFYDKDNNPYHICNICGCITYIEPEGEHVHAFSSNWSSDDTHHWHNAICEHKDLKINVEEHRFSNWQVYDEANGIKSKICEVCDYEITKNILDRLETVVDTTEYPYYPYVTASKDVLLGRNDWIFYLGDKSMEYYKGTNVMSNDELLTNVGKMQRLQDVCDEKGIELIFVELPNKDHIYPEYMPTVEGKLNALTRAQQFNNYIQFNTNLEFTYPLTELIEAKSNYPTYYMQDSHWNDYGGVIAAQEIYRRLGWEFKDYDVEMIDHNGGDLVALSNNTVTALPYQKPFITYKSDISVSQTFTSTYMEEFESTNPNGKKVLLIGDSYRYSLAQFFAREGTNTMFAHRNRLTTKDATYKNRLINYINSLKPGDILIYQFVERQDTDAFKKLDNLLTVIEDNH